MIHGVIDGPSLCFYEAPKGKVLRSVQQGFTVVRVDDHNIECFGQLVEEKDGKWVPSKRDPIPVSRIEFVQVIADF